MPQPDVGLLVRFKHYLETEGELVGDTDEDAATAFLQSERAAELRAAAGEFEADPDPRFTTN